MELRSVIEAQQFKREWLQEELFPLAEKMEKLAKKGGSKILSGKRMITFFYEPSTRTRASFETAMDLLGGKVVFSTENARQFSSAAKGETIEDTMRILSSYYPDVIVLRSDQEGMAKRADQFSAVPIINAGDGAGQHPTQALLDIYTIKKELGKIDGISVAFCGDLNRGRTARSLCYLLGRFSNITIYLVSPSLLNMKEDVKDYLKRHNVVFSENRDIRKVAPLVDVIYQTRIQKERGGLEVEGEAAKGFYVINKEVLSLMRKDAILMHPLPRVDEISTEVDKDKRAAYFRQAENGLYVRMALLKMILS